MNGTSPPQPSKGSNIFAGAFLFLFSLPFAGFGVFAACKGIGNLINGKTQDGLFLCMFGLVFSGVGFGLMLATFLGSRFKKRADALKLAKPDEPWLWRKDWADGRIKSTGKSALISTWIFALFWNLVSSGVFFGMANSKKDPGPGIYIALIFPLIGLGLLIWAIRLTLQWLKFGQSTFKMLSLPGVIGGHLNGAIETTVKLKPEDGFHLKLLCVQRITSGSGKSSSTTENILWEDEKTLVKELLDDDPRRSGIPVYFKIPRDLAESDDANLANRIVWRLEARAEVPGIDYLAQFDVPVFETETSNAEADPAVDPTLAYQAPREPYKLPPHSRITVRTLSDGVTEFYFPAVRNPFMVLYTTVFFLLWSAFTVAAFLLFKSVVFEIVFSLVDVILAYSCFNLWFKSSRVTIAPASVRATNHWLFIGPTRVFDSRDVAGFETKTGMTSGQTVYYNLQLRTNGGVTQTVASYVAGKTEAEWLCAEMGRSLRRV